MGKPVKYIVWHCSATREGQAFTIEDIRKWHVEDRGWRDVGYHYVIGLDGTVWIGRPLDENHELDKMEVGAHVKGLNSVSVGVCYIGGLEADGKTPKDTRTPEQKAALYALTERLLRQFPGAQVVGHNQFAAKACPSFDVTQDWEAHMAAIPVPSPKPTPPQKMSSARVAAIGTAGTAGVSAVTSETGSQAITTVAEHVVTVVGYAQDNADTVLTTVSNPMVQRLLDNMPWIGGGIIGVITVVLILLILFRDAKEERKKGST